MLELPREIFIDSNKRALGRREFWERNILSLYYVIQYKNLQCHIGESFA